MDDRYRHIENMRKRLRELNREIHDLEVEETNLENDLWEAECQFNEQVEVDNNRNDLPFSDPNEVTG